MKTNPRIGRTWRWEWNTGRKKSIKYVLWLQIVVVPPGPPASGNFQLKIFYPIFLNHISGFLFGNHTVRKNRRKSEATMAYNHDFTGLAVSPHSCCITSSFNECLLRTCVCWALGWTGATKMSKSDLLFCPHEIAVGWGYNQINKICDCQTRHIIGI